jgi:hypothetical protein
MFPHIRSHKPQCVVISLYFRIWDHTCVGESNNDARNMFMIMELGLDRLCRMLL